MEPKYAATYWLSKVTDEVLVGVSGGKDSLVTLDLCHRAGLKCAGFFMYIVKDLRYQEEHLEYIQDKYQIKMYRYPHPGRVMLFQQGRYCIPQEMPTITFT